MNRCEADLEIFWAFMFAVLVAVFLFVLPGHSGTTATSGATVQNIIDDVERFLDIDDDDYFDDDDFIQWIDEAVKETANRTGCLEAAPITVTLVANTTRYALGQSFLKIYAVEHDNADTSDAKQLVTLDRVDKTDIGHNNSIGRPSVYCVWNDYLEIWPIPRTTEAGTSLYVYTAALPTGVDSVIDTLETPTYLDTAIFYYVVAQAWMKDNRPDRYAYFMGLYEKRVFEYSTLVIQRKPLD